MLEFRLLGPVEVWAGDGRIALGRAESAKARCLLAVLLRTPGTPVRTEVLVDRVWGDQPVGDAVRYKYIGWLRSALAPHGVALTSHGGGYVLEVDAGQVDLHRFRQLAGQAREADERGAADKASSLLEQALDLWHGTALSGLSGTWIELFRAQLERERRAARVLRARCALKTGATDQALGWLDEWETEYQGDEEIIALRMTALNPSGQHADALAVPRQLPSAVPAFAGRDAELARLDAIVAGAGQDVLPGPAAVVVSAVSGTAGVGKTALAVYWAHRVASRFPDGQLYINLRGFDPSGLAVDPGEAVRGFLDAFGVPPERIPAGLADQAGLYRSLLAGKRVLVVLDNARDAGQVRPLLPGSPGCLAVVTSRDDLRGLVAAEGARPLTLDLFTVAQARDLLARRLGAGRVAREPAAVDDIIAGCARLPLALVIAAARAATYPDFPLAALAAELREASVRLDALHSGDPVTDVRAVFSWSYRTLSAGAARLFRLLGLHPGPDISAAAAASLAGLAPGLAAGLLAELTRAHLLAEYIPGRYAFHDLLRAYAAGQARDHEDDDGRRAAIGRMLDHYLRSAQTADSRLNPIRDRVTTPPRQPGVTGEEAGGYQQVLDWFSAERPVMLAMIGQAPAGFDTYTWQLAAALTSFLERRGRWRDMKTAQTAALAVARREGDRAGQATARYGLGLAHAGVNELDEARSHYLLALDQFSEIGDHSGLAQTHMGFAWAAGAQGHREEALDHYRQSLGHFQAAGQSAGQASVLNSIGWYLAEQGDYDQALEHCQRALVILRDLDDRNSQAHTCDSLGYIYHHLGRHQQAIEWYQQALNLFRASGNRYSEAICLDYLGDVHDAIGETGAARQAWTHALDILRQLDHPAADRIRAKLRPGLCRVMPGYAEPGTSFGTSSIRRLV